LPELPIGEALFGGLALYLLAAGVSVITVRVSYLLSAAASVLVFVGGALALGRPDSAATVPGPLPGVALAVRIDALSAYFVVVIAAISCCVAIYAAGQAGRAPDQHAGDVPSGDHARDQALVDRLLSAGYALFVVSMLAVVTAANAFTFLVAWECMSLLSFGLVISQHQRRDVRTAGWVYFVMTHVATAAILGAFLVLFRATGSFVFADWSAAARTLPLSSRSLVFLLALVGFGTKAGMIPLHIWLPRAHPVAPTPISALMSGVMIKTGIYGLVRIGMDILGPGPAWWGLLVVVLGAVSAVLGVLYALMEHDLKRLLAYHSVENIGIILLGVGVALLGRAVGQPAVAALGLAAALFHVLNHATFKALLFLGAGAVDEVTHTHDMEHLGGLIRLMPVTALFFLVGSAAISALPPLNGFASEWLTFQALLLGGMRSASPLLSVPLLFAGAMLALTGALAVACFVKAFGLTFLALPRGHRAAAGPVRVRETGTLQLVAMGLLSAGCVALGLLAGPVVATLGPITRALTGAEAPALGFTLLPSAAGARLNSPGIALALIVLTPLPWLLARLLAGPVRSRRGETWACGNTLLPINEYSATGFAKPIRLMFAGVIRPWRSVDHVYQKGTRFVASIRYQAAVTPVFEQYVYRRLSDRIVQGAHLVRRLQNGSIQTYLAYLFVALLIVLAVAR
jgi:hydrogenase-4 component B